MTTFVCLEIGDGYRLVSKHRSLEAARKAAWRTARAEYERSCWADLDEAQADPGVFTIGYEREAVAMFGPVEAVRAECAEWGVDIDE